MDKRVPTIAVVDDDATVCQALGRFLRASGFMVQTFASGAEFIEVLEHHRIDCVVLDIHMPGMDGFEVLARMARIRGAPAVVVVTGHDAPELEKRVVAAGVARLILKPVSGNALLSGIREAIAREPSCDQP